MAASNSSATSLCAGQWINFCDAKSAGMCASMNEAVAVTPKITAMFSMIGVSLIIYRFMVMKPRARKTYDRLLFGMSIMNFWGSFGFFLGQWTFPSIPAGERNSPFCSFQGWLLQINAAVFWYNAILATNFVLRIRVGWSEDNVRKWEPLMHIVAWLFPTVTSFIALGMNMYGRSGPWCWISVQYDWARWAFFFVELWILMIYSACCMFSIVLTVKRSDDQTAFIRDSQTSRSSRGKGKRLGKKTRQVAIQAMLYVATFLLTWVFGTANRIQNAVVSHSATPCNVFALTWLHSLFVPAQGFFNFIVYIYPRIKESEKKKEARRRSRSSSEETPNLPKRCINALSDTLCQGYSVVFGRERSTADSHATGGRYASSAGRDRQNPPNEGGQPKFSTNDPKSEDESNSNEPPHSQQTSPVKSNGDNEHGGLAKTESAPIEHASVVSTEAEKPNPGTLNGESDGTSEALALQ